MSERKKEVAFEGPRNAVVTGSPNEPKSIVFENGPASNDDFTNEFHSLPCKIKYDGPAKVSQYFIPKELGDEKKVATFRGRILNGEKQHFPDGYRLYVAVEKENKDNNRVFEVNGSATSFTRWEYDRSASHRSCLAQAIDFVYGEPLSVLVGVGSAIAASVSIFSYYARCKLLECCSTHWIRGNYAGLQHSMRTRLYGQHLAKETIITAAIAHWQNPNPKKALVMSFHGWTGCGKNYLSSMIIENLYMKGMKSDYVHVYISTLHFSNYFDIPLYQVQLRSWIQGNVSKCERSLFVFDEVDKMPAKVIDVLKPFIDHYEHLEGVDFRKSIFIFLSNSGSNEIAQKTLQHYEDGKIREKITLKEMEAVVMASAFNTEGGLKMSELISAHLIDHFVPFLPLERRHILLCIRDYMLSHEFTPTDERVTAIADSLQYFPKTNPIYSSSGCKRVAQKTELFMSMEQEKHRRRFESFEDDDIL